MPGFQVQKGLPVRGFWAFLARGGSGLGNLKWSSIGADILEEISVAESAENLMNSVVSILTPLCDGDMS